MEGADGDEHDRTHESAKHMFDDDGDKVRGRCTSRWEGHDNKLREDSGSQSADEGPTPYSDRLVFFAPHSRVVAEEDLERKVDQNGKREIFLAESFVEEFEVRDGVVRLETDLSDQVDDDEDLDVAQLHDAAHDFVDVHDAVFLFRTLLTLEERKSKSYGKVRPAPENEVSVECEEASLLRRAAEEFVGEIRTAESKEDRVAEELASSEANSLCGRRVRQVGGREQSERPAVNSNILSGAEEDKRKPPTGESPNTSSAVRASFFHHLLRAGSQPDHAQSAQYLYGQNPTLSPSDLRAPHGVHDGTPK
jgi:hypothetical protein